MILYEALLSAPHERVKSIAIFYGIEEPKPDDLQKQSDLEAVLANRVASHLLVPANAMVAMNGLNQEEVLALRLITVAAGGLGVVIEQCHQKLNQLSRKWRRNGAKVIEALIARGLVFTRREEYRHIYFVPSDLGPILADFFLSDIFDAAALGDTRFTPRHGVDVATPLRHICLFLSYVRKNEVKLTQSGTIFKKAQNDISILIEEDEETMDETLFPVRYAPRLAFLLYFARSRDLVEEKNNVLRIGPKAKEWMDKPYTQWRQDLFEYWHSSFASQDVDLQTLLWIIMRTPEGSILSLETILTEMDTLSTTHSPHGLNLRVEKNLIDFLEYLGGLEVTKGINGIHVRPTLTGKALFGLTPEFPDIPLEQHVYVQSNFEVLVPCTVEPRLLWSIDAFAELVKPDQMMVYKLTRDSVYQALVHSYSPETILEFLNRHSKVPVPQNVAYSIAHWGRAYGRIEFEHTILLKCDTPELADELMLYPKIRSYLKERVGPCHLVVKNDSYEQLVAALSEGGYMPKLSGIGQLNPGIADQTR